MLGNVGPRPLAAVPAAAAADFAVGLAVRLAAASTVGAAALSNPRRIAVSSDTGPSGNADGLWPTFI
jgi:hypothetical protein